MEGDFGLDALSFRFEIACGHAACKLGQLSLHLELKRLGVRLLKVVSDFDPESLLFGQLAVLGLVILDQTVGVSHMHWAARVDEVSFYWILLL